MRSGSGGDGKAVLIFEIPAEGNFKVGSDWKKLSSIHQKVSGTWRRFIGGYYKVSGVWKAIWTSEILFQSNAVGFGNGSGGVTSGTRGSGGVPTINNIPSNAPNIEGDSGGSNFCPHPEKRMGVRNMPDAVGHGTGGADNSKIICTKLYELGYLPHEIYEADQKFGEWMRKNDPYAYYGYIKWASVVVDWMTADGPQCMFWIKDKKIRGEKQKNLAIKWARRIATPWAQHMAYRMGTLPQDNFAGKMIMQSGMFISRIIGKKHNALTNKNSIRIGFGLWAVFGLFYLLAGLPKGKTSNK